MPRVLNVSQLPSAGQASNVSRRAAQRTFYEFMGFRDRYLRYEDFLQDTIDLDYWALEKTATANEVNFAIDVTLGAGHGAITAVSGDTTNDAVSAIGPIIYKGDKNCGMWARFMIDNVTNVEFEVGFVQAKIGSNASAVTDVDTPTVAMTDGAVFHCNVNQTLTTPAFVTEGSTSNQGIKATSTPITPTNACYMEVIIQIMGDDAVGLITNHSSAGAVTEVARADHNTRGSGNSAGYIEGGTALAPWLYVSTLASELKKMTVDAVAIWSDR